MSSSTMHEPLAIRLQDVSKIYRLHGSQGDQLIDVLGLQRFGFKTKTQAKEFAALSNISLEVPRGHRIGIVGRNGAGKTTLLKLICGNFTPTHGEVEVNGGVQALMNVGLGFHPEYTGRENVEASLQYNGLSRTDYQQAMDGIIEFCELGDFLDQPFKTYSLGMQARLMFAAATAIRPDILIVDEVLGAGDAYFVAKSKVRVEKLVSSGCTMLLVSHSMQQVLELCDEAIWLEGGAIKMRGESFLVVKAYEESLHGRLQSILPVNIVQSPVALTELKGDNDLPLGQAVDVANCSRRFSLSNDIKLQVPEFLPHANQPAFRDYSPADVAGFSFVAPGGISRWDAEKGVKLLGFSIQTERGFENRLLALRPARFIFLLVGDVSADFCCRYGIAINDLLGNVVVRIYSPPDRFRINESEVRIVEMVLNPVQLGPGEYTLGISVLEATELELINSATRYDLLGRSFSIKVELEETMSPISANFIHSAEWDFRKGV
jgi:lipopolysaccharide transport system ATP-binding protein